MWFAEKEVLEEGIRGLAIGIGRLGRNYSVQIIFWKWEITFGWRSR